MKTIITVVLTLLAAALIGTGIVYSGVVGVGADEPHAGPTASVLATTRIRAIARAARDVAVPANLADPTLIASGAGEYAEMCTECHLAPGMKETELRAGLNPKPPDFSRAVQGTPAEQFWIVKHGIRMTGMPAWGLTHDDERLWSMVAFLQKLPGLGEADYRALVGSGEGGHHHHDEGHEDEDHEDEGPGEDSAGHSHEHADEHATPAATVSLSGNVAPAASVIDDFQHKLHHGDTRGASSLLDPTVLIFEGGNVERSRAEYASHHLNADSEFLKSATVRPLSRHGGSDGDLAWVATESEITTQGAKPQTLLSTETMILEKNAQGWRVAHIHWSSRQKK